MSAAKSSTTSSAIVSLPSDREIVITRMFDAPPSLVFETMTKPEHVLRWWGPRTMKMTVCEIDLRVGGKYTYVHCTPDGQEFRFIGEYREIDPPHRLVATETFDEPKFGSPTSLNTVTLEDVGGRTKFVNRILHASKENRDGHINAGMEGGMQETFNRLDELLWSMQ